MPATRFAAENSAISVDATAVPMAPESYGHYSPDWAIVFHEGKVKHIYFIAETKGTMESLNLRPIEKSKIDCARKLFAKLSDGLVTYDHVDSYQELMNKVLQ